jgi:molybdenum cofactor cytidylyltransferase
MASNELKTVGIILAAGLSRRMGKVKSLLPWGDSLLLDRVIENANFSTLSSLIVVLGHEADIIREKIDFKAAKVVVNSEYGTGQSSSLRAGLDALPVGTDGAMFLLGDQPFVSTKIINNLICAFQKQPSGLIIPTYEGKRGNPVLVHSSIFDMVQGITGDTGARVIFRSLGSQVREVEVTNPGILVDIDTLEEYRRFVHLPDDSRRSRS